MVVLLAAVTASVIALFVRGFRIQDLTKDNTLVSTPSMQTWLVVTSGYPSKMDAYKDGIAQSTQGYAIHVYQENTTWVLVKGAYLAADEANAVLQNGNLPEQTSCREYIITGKQFKIEQSAAANCNAVLGIIEQTLNKLWDVRGLVSQEQPIDDAILVLTDYYNQLKNLAKELHAANTTLKSEVVSTIIYAANQNILNLHELIFADQASREYLSLINTAIVKSIFSLDNFWLICYYWSGGEDWDLLRNLWWMLRKWLFPKACKVTINISKKS